MSAKKELKRSRRHARIGRLDRLQAHTRSQYGKVSKFKLRPLVTVDKFLPNSTKRENNSTGNKRDRHAAKHPSTRNKRKHR